MLQLCCFEGKKKVQDMNIYLAPLIDELTMLWITRTPAYDASAEADNRHFQLRAILLWILYDFLGYGVCSSLQT